jgi:putative endonuclease
VAAFCTYGKKPSLFLCMAAGTGFLRPMLPQRNHKTPQKALAPSWDRASLGRRGEQVAACWLSARGFRLLAKNWRYRRLELDLLMAPPRDAGILVVVEVKTLQVPEGGLDAASEAWLRPENAIDAAKQQRLGRAGRAALSAFPQYRALRFDWVAIRVDGWRCRLLHFPDAFFPGR